MGKSEREVSALLAAVSDPQSGEWLPYPKGEAVFGNSWETFKLPNGTYVRVWVTSPKRWTSFRVAVQFESNGTCVGVFEDYDDLENLGARKLF